jgi:hypothetical protein
VGDVVGTRERSDVPVAERTSMELVELVKKLQWIGMRKRPSEFRSCCAA